MLVSLIISIEELLIAAEVLGGGGLRIRLC